MKRNKLSYFFIAYLISFTSLRINPLYSSATILNCNSQVPKGPPCLIKASSYKVEIQKLDICSKNPFPDFRTTPDYAGSLCLSLFDKTNNSSKLNLTNDLKLKIPDNTLDNREYRYISIIYLLLIYIIFC